MLDKKGFDLWADDYDKTVGVSDEENTYPFAGYCRPGLHNALQVGALNRKHEKGDAHVQF